MDGLLLFYLYNVSYHVLPQKTITLPAGTHTMKQGGMRMSKRFGIIGGDRRQAELARLLRQDGHQVVTCGLREWRPEEEDTLDRAAEQEVVILPLPLCRGEGVLNCREDPVTTVELFRKLAPWQTVLAGQVLPDQRREAETLGLRVIDYFTREELKVANAAATAEAALQVAMEQSDRLLLGGNCLVLGFGRIGRLLAFRLRGLGALVTAAARKPEDLAWIRAYGCEALEIGKLDGHLSCFRAVFSTVPSLVLDEGLLAQLPEDCLCVDLASTPGIDLAAAERRGMPQVRARSLPGRLVPRAAAEIIRDTVYHILEERGDLV